MEMYRSCVENIRRRRELDGEQNRLLQRQRRIQMLRSLRRTTLRNQPRRQQPQQELMVAINEQETNKKFWEEIVPEYSDDKFQKKFRLHMSSFNYLCNKLTDVFDLSRITSVPIRKKVALSLFILKTNKSLYKASKKFEVSKKTALKILEEFCVGINTLLYPGMVHMPRTSQALQNDINEFKNKTGFINCYGAIDCLHIPIKKDGNNNPDSLNAKGYYSLVLISIVNSKSIFRHIHFGSQGKLTNTQVFTSAKVEQNIMGHNDVCHMLGNETFPLRINILTPFEPDPLTRIYRNELYNSKHDKVMSHSKTAHNKLKGRWRILMRKPNFDINTWKQIMTTCITLHNFCEAQNEIYYPSWQDKVDEFNERYPQPRQKYQFMRQLVTAYTKKIDIAENFWKNYVEQ
jgi:hypothetical protein